MGTEEAKERRVLVLDGAGRELPGGHVGERRDAARNRERVLEAARALFEERGVTCVTMEEIARAAGVGKGTLYRRYPHKGSLCYALLDEPTRVLQAEVLVALRDYYREDPLGGLRWFVGRLARHTEEHLDLLYGGLEALSGAERLAVFGWPSRLWQRWTIVGLLHAAERAGEFEGDAEYMADALLATLDVELYYHQRRVLGFSAGRIEEGVRALVPR